MAWHGLDKLVELAKTFPDLMIDIVGMSEIEGISDLPGNLILHGYLSGDAYEAMLASADAAIGTLSLHVKGMDQVAPLKIRDCSARGIPCILPYRDIDFADLDSQLFLQIPNRVDSIKLMARLSTTLSCRRAVNVSPVNSLPGGSTADQRKNAPGFLP